MAGKTEVSASTKLGYNQVVREFLAYLGPRRRKRRLESITEADIRGFVAQLESEGRSSGTITKLVRKYLSTAFEKARLRGRIKFNPVRAIDPKKVDVSVRDTFTPEQVAALLRLLRREVVAREADDEQERNAERHGRAGEAEDPGLIPGRRL